MTASNAAGSTRRRLLRTAVNVGVGAGLVWGVGTDYVSGGDVVEIEYALVRSTSGGESLTPRTKTVPADWYASMETAFDAQRELREAGLSSIVGAFVVPGSLDDPAASIAVDATSGGVAESVADVAGNVDFDVNVLDAVPPKPADPTIPADPYHVADLEDGRVPGGVHCRSPVLSGTLAPAAVDAETGDRFFLTSNHVYGAAGAKETEHRGEPLDLVLDDGRETIGRVERGHPEADVVRVSPAAGFEPAARIANVSPARVIGQFTRIGLADLMARDVTLRKFGAFSGRTTGKIRGVDGFTCYMGEVCKPGQLKWGDKRTITDGDSGSVGYAPDPEHPEAYAIAAGVNNARSWWPGADFTWGTAAFQLLEAHGIHF